MLVSLKYPASANTAPGRCPVLAAAVAERHPTLDVIVLANGQSLGH